jgi:hypothetical protein
LAADKSAAFFLGCAAILVAVTATVGCAVGYLFAQLWNQLGGEKAR